jgi:diguanylate cyclase (GGDEF)-like protein/PAS domain S-box-containing protein
MMTQPDRDVFARRWADAIVGTSDVSWGRDELVAYLVAMTDQLVEAALVAEFEPLAGRTIGRELSLAHCVGTDTLSKTLALIIEWLPDLLAPYLPGVDVANRVARLTGEIAAGYASAVRQRGGDEPDTPSPAGSRVNQTDDPALAGKAESGPVGDVCVGITITEPGGRIVQITPSLEHILGYSPGQLPGHQLHELFSPEEWPLVQQRYQDLLTGRETRFQVRCLLRRADGDTGWVRLSASVLNAAELSGAPQPLHLVTIVDDITELELLQQQLRHQSLHDPQTGLPNRHYLLTHLEQVMARGEPSAVVTMMHLDLDGFSAIHDGLGCHAGEQLLDAVARRLERVVTGQAAMVAHLGDDEYAILLEPGTHVVNVGALAKNINAELAEPLYIDGTGVALTASIGVVQRRVGECTPEELMREASATLHRMRGQGPRQWALYDPSTDAVDRAQLRLAATLPGALETGQLQVSYQPVFTFDDHQLVAIEAALSWAHPHLGELSHKKCIRAAERTGVVHELGEWLLRTAAGQAVAWRQRIGTRDIPMVVNLAVSQAQDPDLVARLRTVLEQTGVQPTEVELHAPVAALRTITGDLAGEGGGQALDNLRVLTELGLRTGLHDFSGGIGALCCLAELPIRVVRTTPPAPHQIAEGPSPLRYQAAQAVIGIVRAAGINVIAYPVNTAEHATCWTTMGANWALGAFFSPPGPPQHIETLLTTRTTT